MRKTLDRLLAAKWREACADLRRQLAHRLFSGFFAQELKTLTPVGLKRLEGRGMVAV